MISYKNIIVTGASSGIGKSIMEELLEQEGNRILAACRRAEKVAGYGENVVPFSCDPVSSAITVAGSSVTTIKTVRISEINLLLMALPFKCKNPYTE